MPATVGDSGFRPFMASHLLPFLAVLALLFAGAASDLSADRAALLAFRAAVGGRSILWNVSAPTPCAWLGVTCSGGRVTELRLPGSSLTGSIPTGTIGKLTALRSLSLRFNHLSGPLPQDLVALEHLRILYLNGNAFSGGILGTLFALSNLVRLDLANNELTGPISLAFNKLTRLQTLFLEDNQLTGALPRLDLSVLVQFNVSNNRLNGSIPAKLRAMPASAFLGNHLCGRPLGPCSDDGSSTPAPAPPLVKTPPAVADREKKSSDKKSKLSGGAVAGIAIGAAVGFLVFLLLLMLLCRKTDRTDIKLKETAMKPRESEVALTDKKVVSEKGTMVHPEPSPSPAPAPAPAPASAPAFSVVAVAAGGPIGSNKKLVFLGRVHGFYDLEDLLRASAEVLGKGTMGTSYKAMLEMGTMVVVKRLRDTSLPEKEFRDKVNAVGAMDHPNLVALQAYYYSKDEKLLVYEYVPNGSLSSLLHGNRGSGRAPLDWETRLAIAHGAARGVEYIHSKGPNVSHGNIKSSNVLLGKSFVPRVSDSGLCSLASSPSPGKAAGYRAPEVTDVRKISQKADVYSFGVLLLELLTGKAPAQAVMNDEGVDLPRWVQSVVREEWTSEVFDAELLRYQNVEEELVQLLQLAIDCVVQYPDKRPSISEVVARIEEIQRSSINDQEQDGSMYDQSEEPIL